MQIYGVRIYPQSVTALRGAGGAPFFIHGSVSKRCSDFFYIFAPIAHLWNEQFFVQDFSISYELDANSQVIREDPLPSLHAEYGEDLVGADVEHQMMLLRGAGFAEWGSTAHFREGASLPIMREVLPFAELSRIYWERDFRLSSATWPQPMSALLYMWDDIYWEFYSPQQSDVSLLVSTHKSDAALKLFVVDIDQDYPDPSNRTLLAAE